MNRIEYDFTKAGEGLRQILEDELPFSTSLGMNRALSKTRNHIKEIMDDHIEGTATPFTKRGMRVYPTAKFALDGAITFVSVKGDRDKNRDYMQELMYGGNKKAENTYIPEPMTNNMRKFEPKMLTPRGNVNRKFYVKATKPKSKKYFVGIPRAGKKHWAGNEKLRGIWRRDPETGKINMLISLKRTARRQRKTFDAPGIAKEYFNNIVNLEIKDAYFQTLRGGTYR